MVRTAILLIITIVLLPLLTFKLDPQALSPDQWHMLKVSGLIMFTTSLMCFTIAELTGNCSQVDKIWSVMPVIYAWYFSYASNFDHRVLLMALCVTIWGVRLTYNFSRRGAYRLKFWEGEEDYRWAVVRENPMFKGNPWRFKLFNLVFISLYQNTLLWLFTLPALVAYSAIYKPLGWIDYLLAALFTGLVVLETIADQQQWNYQNEKIRRKNAGEKPLDGDHGFIRTGLWKHVRHPNYACEQTIWIVFYLFTIIPDGRWINWGMTGCLLLLILFQASADFSEGISTSKYPAYKDHINKIPRFIPRFW